LTCWPVDEKTVLYSTIVALNSYLIMAAKVNSKICWFIQTRSL